MKTAVLTLCVLPCFYAGIVAWIGRNASSQADVCARVTSSPDFPDNYSAFCDEKSIGQKQAWNKNKKIITFALFDDQNPSGQLPDIQSESSFSWYLEGALHNIKGAKLYYPDWVVRIYVFGLNETVEALLLESSNNAELVRCWASTPLDVSSSRKMTARFLSYDDPDTMYLISRDLDSRFNPRELFAVNEWISSGLHFHVMRDHDQHDVPVLGGMFGIRRGALTGKVTTMADLLSSAFAQEPNGITGMRGEDQSFLAKYVWPLVSSNAITHDVSEERCQRYGSSLCRGFPIGDDDKHTMFVGQDFKPSGHYAGMHVSQYKCTFACEPSEIKNF